MASASWPAVTARACGSSPTTATISLSASRSPWQPWQLSRRSFLIDGEAIVTDDDGLAVFELVRPHKHGRRAVLCAFDLIELDGQDLRRQPIEKRKSTLQKLLRQSAPTVG